MTSWVMARWEVNNVGASLVESDTSWIETRCSKSDRAACAAERPSRARVWRMSAAASLHAAVRISWRCRAKPRRVEPGDPDGDGVLELQEALHCCLTHRVTQQRCGLPLHLTGFGQALRPARWVWRGVQKLRRPVLSRPGSCREATSDALSTRSVDRSRRSSGLLRCRTAITSQTSAGRESNANRRREAGRDHRAWTTAGTLPLISPRPGPGSTM